MIGMTGTANPFQARARDIKVNEILWVLESAAWVTGGRLAGPDDIDDPRCRMLILRLAARLFNHRYRPASEDTWAVVKRELSR